MCPVGSWVMAAVSQRQLGLAGATLDISPCSEALCWHVQNMWTIGQPYPCCPVVTCISALARPVCAAPRCWDSRVVLLCLTHLLRWRLLPSAGTSDNWGGSKYDQSFSAIMPVEGTPESQGQIPSFSGKR